MTSYVETATCARGCARSQGPRFLKVVAVVLSLSASPVLAGPICAGPCTWAPVATAVNPFWNGTSWDGPTAGIGHKLAGQPNLEFLSGGGETSVGFGWSVLFGQLTLANEISDYQNVNRFGWHSMPGSSYWAGAWSGEIFSGSDGAGVTRFISPPIEHIGFWLLSPDFPYLFSSLDTNHFALFRSVVGQTMTYYLGIEDLSGVSDWDYQDLIVTWGEACGDECPSSTVPVPEPGTLILLGTGLLGIARRFRR